MTLEKELEGLKTKLKKLQDEKVSLSYKLEVLEKRKSELLEECKGFGVDPKKIDEAVDTLEKELSDAIKAIKEKVDAI